MTSVTKEALIQEFDRQVNTLVEKKYPEAAGIAHDAFIDLLNPLKKKVESLHVNQLNIDYGYAPFVLVITHKLIPSETMMKLVERQGTHGVVSMTPLTPNDFHAIDTVNIPSGPAYILVDIDRGKDSLNITPEQALIAIHHAKRSPLTIDEGIALVTHYPDLLMKNNCYSLLASRRDDQRVPAIWLSEHRPKLGWCWDRNPHTWLGSASCRERVI